MQLGLALGGGGSGSTAECGRATISRTRSGLVCTVTKTLKGFKENIRTIMHNNNTSSLAAQRNSQEQTTHDTPCRNAED